MGWAAVRRGSKRGRQKQNVHEKGRLSALDNVMRWGLPHTV